MTPEATIEMGELVTESKSDIGWKNVVEYKEHPGSIKNGSLAPIVKRIDALQIVREAQSLIGAFSHPEDIRSTPWSASFSSELDIDASLDIDPNLGTLLVVEKIPIQTEVVICLDTSLSMTGEKFRIASLAIAATSLQLGVQNLSIICFDSNATCIKKLGKSIPTEELVYAFLQYQPHGLTNMEAALQLAKQELARGQTRRQHVIMISDGRFTAGKRPDEVAGSISKLHCIQTGSPWSKNRLYRRLAKKGQGKFLHVKRFSDLPRRLYELVREISR